LNVSDVFGYIRGTAPTLPIALAFSREMYPASALHKSILS